METPPSSNRTVEQCLSHISAQRDALSSALGYINRFHTNIERLIGLKRIAQAAAQAQAAADEAYEVLSTSPRAEIDVVKVVEQLEFPFVTAVHETFHRN